MGVLYSIIESMTLNWVLTRIGRRRKVRCSYPSDQAGKCVHCVRRGSTCVPQGEDVESESGVPVDTEERSTASGESGEGGFSEALKGLQQNIVGLFAEPEGSTCPGIGVIAE